MTGAPLPKDTMAGAMRARCPWCGASPGEATVSLEAILDAWEAHELDFASRQDDGTASTNALTADCPTCANSSRKAMWLYISPLKTIM